MYLSHRHHFADVFLNASVESPIKIKAGDSTIFKVEKSDLGALFWTHDEKLVDDKSPHYTLNANKTELEIVAARLEQAGIYEIVLKEGRCEISKVFEVQIYVAGLRPVFCCCFGFLVSDRGESLKVSFTSFIAKALAVPRISC